MEYVGLTPATYCRIDGIDGDVTFQVNELLLLVSVVILTPRSCLVLLVHPFFSPTDFLPMYHLFYLSPPHNKGKTVHRNQFIVHLHVRDEEDTGAGFGSNGMGR